MARIQGRLGRLSVSSDGGSTFSTLGCVIDMSMSGNADELEVTCHESGQSREYLQGRKDATVEGSAYWDEADPGQNIVENAYFDSTQIVTRFRMQEGSGFKEYQASAIVTSWAPSSPNDDAATVDFSLRINGDFTKQFQA